MLILGSHMSIDRGFAEAAIKTGKTYQANAMQLFTKSPRSRVVKPLNPEAAKAFRDKCRELKIVFVVAHSSYLINIAKPLSQAPWMLTDLKTDFERLAALGGDGVVVHIGKRLEQGLDQSIDHLVSNTQKVLEETATYLPENQAHENAPYFIFENTAGQGTELGSTLEEITLIWTKLKQLEPQHLKRIKFCLDTAHLWGAGYDLSSRDSVNRFFNAFDSAVGLKHLACLHFNDSKKERGSKVDRHDNLLQGQIGEEGLKAIVKFAEINNIPLILETPEKDGHTHLGDINIVRERLLN